jgi:cell division protein FtsQ
VIKKRYIRKFLIAASCSVAIAGISLLLVAANRVKREHVCKELLISIKGSGETFYIQKADIIRQIQRATNGGLIQKPVVSIDLHKIEQSLKSNAWIKEAQLFFDTNDNLNISVKEREPIARVYSEDASFYIDSSGQEMPLIENAIARVPVILGYPVHKHDKTVEALLSGVKKVSTYIYTHPFWNSQIGEIIITDQKKFELVPVIGDQSIKIGNAENLDGKFNNLLVFYKQVLSKTGLNRYKAIDVEFNGQIIGIKKDAVSAVDSIQLQKNIDALINSRIADSSNQNLSKDAEKNLQSTSTKTNESNPKEETKKPELKSEREPKAVMKKIVE